MLISEAFRVYETQYMNIKYRSIRLFQTHRRVGRTLVEEIGDKDISELCLDDIARWSAKLSRNVKANTMRNNLGAIRSVLDYMQIIGVPCISKNLVPVPKREDSITTWLTAEEVAQMIATASSIRNKFIISLIYASGLRVSELISLDRGQINNRTFLVKGKGAKVRSAYIDRRTEALMEQYLGSREDSSPALVVSNILKDRLTRGTVELVIKNSARRAGINKRVTPHTLRHSFATNFIDNNGNPRTLQVLLGHASLNTTQIYTHIRDREVRERYEQFHTV